MISIWHEPLKTSESFTVCFIWRFFSSPPVGENYSVEHWEQEWVFSYKQDKEEKQKTQNEGWCKNYL